MHELSLALEVCRIAEQHAAPRPASAIRTVAVLVGAEAGIEVDNFRFCLEALLSDAPFSGARLDIQPIPGDDLRVTHLEVDDDRPDD